MASRPAPGVVSGGLASGVVPGVTGDAPRAHAVGQGYRGGDGAAGLELQPGSIGQALGCLLSADSVVPPRLPLEQRWLIKQKVVPGM